MKTLFALVVVLRATLSDVDSQNPIIKNSRFFDSKLFDKMKTAAIAAKFMSRVKTMDEKSMNCFADTFWDASGVNDGPPEAGQTKSEIFKSVAKEILAEIKKEPKKFTEIEDGVDKCVDQMKTGRSLYDGGDDDDADEQLSRFTKKKKPPNWMYGHLVYNV